MRDEVKWKRDFFSRKSTCRHFLLSFIIIVVGVWQLKNRIAHFIGILNVRLMFEVLRRKSLQNLKKAPMNFNKINGIFFPNHFIFLPKNVLLWSNVSSYKVDLHKIFTTMAFSQFFTKADKLKNVI